MTNGINYNQFSTFYILFQLSAIMFLHGKKSFKILTVHIPDLTGCGLLFVSSIYVIYVWILLLYVVSKFMIEFLYLSSYHIRPCHMKPHWYKTVKNTSCIPCTPEVTDSMIYQNPLNSNFWYFLYNKASNHTQETYHLDFPALVFSKQTTYRVPQRVIELICGWKFAVITQQFAYWWIKTLGPRQNGNQFADNP